MKEVNMVGNSSEQQPVPAIYYAGRALVFFTIGIIGMEKVREELTFNPQEEVAETLKTMFIFLPSATMMLPFCVVLKHLLLRQNAEPQFEPQCNDFADHLQFFLLAGVNVGALYSACELTPSSRVTPPEIPQDWLVFFASLAVFITTCVKGFTYIVEEPAITNIANSTPSIDDPYSHEHSDKYKSDEELLAELRDTTADRIGRSYHTKSKSV